MVEIPSEEREPYRGQISVITRIKLVELSVVLVCLSAACGLSAQTAYLGILEDVPGIYAGEPNSRAVRVVFQKEGHGWRALPSQCPDQTCLKTIASSYPPEVKWTITFNGRDLGLLTGRTPNEFKFYSQVGQQRITSTALAPVVGKRSAEFGGFTDQAVYRPLVVNSQPFFKDPESWKPSELRTELVGLLRHRFRRMFRKVSNCESPEENASKLWIYQDTDIRILKAYSSNRGWSVVELRLENYRCDGPPDEAFINHWFAIAPSKELVLLDHGMWLVDAGDYDNDGKSELVFSINRYNRGGYELFYDDFKKKAKFEFPYH